MELLTRAIGPIATNVQILADARTREAIAIDTAIPSLAWISDELAARGWTLKLIVSTHGHWDHIGDNAALAAQTGARSPSTRSTANGWSTHSRSSLRSRSRRRCPPWSWPKAARSGSARSASTCSTPRATPRVRSA